VHPCSPVETEAMKDFRDPKKRFPTTMNPYLELATSAAREAGAFLRDNYESELEVDAMHDHDIKLQLDVRTQELITDRILAAFPDHAIFGEEGIAGNQDSPFQWIVDPIDGTVNYFYGIPHFSVSIAMRENGELKVGVIYDPMMDELFAAEAGGAPTLNGREMRTSSRDQLRDAVVTVGFSKTKEAMDAGMERYRKISYRVKKIRIMGSAALAMAYVACGRLDAYLEEQISLWDIAAGQLLVEAAGGSVQLSPAAGGSEKYTIVSQNGKLPLEDF
jgi:myo-inositol-1(or 4)-monophosphatase